MITALWRSERSPDLRRKGLAALVAVVAAFASASHTIAQTTSARVTGVELTTSVQLTLKAVGDRSIKWHQACLANDQEEAEKVLDELMSLADSLGVERLPDISLSALARAVEAAGDGDFARARWSLAAAERLDSGRPETAFASATVHAAEGGYLWMVTDYFRGLARIAGQSQERALWLHNAALWLLYSLLISGALYAALLLGVRGGPVMRGIAVLFRRFLPRPLAYVAMAALLIGPLLLPSGLLWFLLLWSALLWSFGTVSERIVIVLLWLLAGSAQPLLEEQQKRIVAILSPPVRALDSLAERRLYGSLFTDLGVLRSLLADSVATRHLIADLHWSLGQRQIARDLYRQLLDEEPDNSAAQVNLGAYYYFQDDFGQAARFFQQAAVSDPQNAAAYFNLSRAYTASYLYDDSARALSSAQKVDSGTVSRWIQEGDRRPVRAVLGGYARIPALRAQLLADEEAASESPSVLELLRGWLGVVVALGLLVMAGALRLARRDEGPEIDDEDSMDTPGDLMLRVIVPGLRSARTGNGVAAYLAFVPAVGLLLLLGGSWSYRVPWGYDPGDPLGVAVAAAGLLLLLLVRLVLQRRLDV